jgi:curli biogenesis system outer membrane secretion channel CsgG
VRRGLIDSFRAVLKTSVPSVVSLLLASCTSPSGRGWFGDRAPVTKPVVAVMDFENKTSFSGQWNLGQGMADVLVAQLMETERVVVLERRHIGDVVNELDRQGQGLFRPEGRVERGRLKNAQYLIRGAVTDFTVVGDVSGWFGVQDKATVRGRGERARVALVITVSDVASGEVLSSVQAEGDASAGGLGVGINYRQLSFGGDAFFRTPLGRATERAMERAVKRILYEVPPRPWEPRVAEVSGRDVVLNGGEDVRLKEGQNFVVREAPQPVTDPVTGNVIDVKPGKVIGRIRVLTIKETASYGVLEEGTARRGDMLEIAP